MLLSLGHDDRAYEVLSALPESAEACYLKAIACSRLGRREEGRKWLDRACELKETFDIVIKDKIIGGSDTDNNNEGLGGIQQGAGQIVFGVNQTADTNVKVPKTGDETNAVPALIVLAVSASVAVGTLAAGRRRQRR